MTTPLRILIVEDSQQDAELMLLELSRGGIVADSKRVETADEMLAALAEVGPWDIVLSDFSLPGFSAADALAFCREADPDLPFVVVSGTIGEQRAVEMMRAGAGDYLLKGNLARLPAAVERELREAENRRARRRADRAASLLAALVQSSNDAIIAKTVEGIITNWNPAAALLFGWTMEEVVGRHVTFLVPADYVEEHNAIKKRLENGDRVAAFETVRLHKDGMRMEVSLAVSTLQDSDGRLIGWSWIVRDITERKRVESELNQTTSLLRAVAYGTPDAVFVKDRAGHYLLVNPAAAGFIGRPVEDILGRDDAELFERGDAQRIIEDDRHVMESGKPFTRVQRMVSSGGTRTYMTTKALYLDANRCVAGVIGVSRDISELEQATDTLRISEARYRTLIAATTSIVWSSPPSGEFNTVLSGWTEFTGQTLEEHRGWGWLNVIHPDDQQKTAMAWALAMADRAMYEDEHQLRRADGVYRNMIVRAVPILEPGGAIREWVGVHTDVTEQKVTEEAVRASEARFRAFMDNSPTAAFIKDEEGQYVYANPTWRRQFESEPIDWLGKTDYDFWPREAAELFRASDAKCLAQDSFIQTEESARTPSGDERTWLVIKFPLVVSGQRRVGGMAWEISERKRFEQALELRDRAIQAASQGIVISDTNQPDNPLIYVSPGFERMTGYDSGEVLGRNCRFLQGKDSDLAAVAKLREAIRDGLPCNVELLNYRKDGKPFWNALSISPIHDSAHQVTHFVAVQLDVTERKRAEATLRDQEELLRNVIAHIPAGVFWKDRDGRFLGANDRFAHDQGFSTPDEVVGKMDLDLPFTRAEAEAFRTADMQVMALGEPLLNVAETQTRPDNRMIHLLVSKVPLRDTNGQVSGVLGVYQDVTEARLLEEQFRQAQKMEAFGQLAGGVAHDFNNLLTIINGYSEMLLDRLPESDPSRNMISEIYTAGERSAGLTRQLLAFSRKQIMVPRILNLNEVVADTDKMLRRLIGEDIRLTTSLETQPWAVKADPGQIEQVLLNLAVNARDAMPDGGRLTIETENIVLDESYVRTQKDACIGGHVVLSVSDSGSGIPPLVLAKIFEPFFTTKEQGKGTGLGLATVYGIVKQSGGHVAVYSEVGIGTTFKLYLPKAEQASESLKPPSRILAAPRGTETILLAEDEAGVRMLTRTILVACGYRVLEAVDGDQALKVAVEYDGPIHLLITDVVMPGVGGRAVAEKLTEWYPRLRVIYVSGYTDDAVIRHGVLREGVNFIQKPFSPAAIARKVRDVLDDTTETGSK
jgi:two-component system cell cycle sensor histidine kinase/response regulator CckA